MPVEQQPGFSHIHESPLRRRYGSEAMKQLWAPESQLLLVRDVWIANARAQMRLGLATPEQVDDLVAHRNDLDYDEIESREMDEDNPRYTGHDIQAHISQYADVAPIGAPIIHRGLTSEDPLSTAEIITVKKSLDIVRDGVVDVLGAFAPRIAEFKDKICMGYTHGQAAEPTTVGYRLARYAQDFLMDLEQIDLTQKHLKSKGMKGTVGTGASFTTLLKGTGVTPAEYEAMVMEELGVDAVTISGQTYPRKLTHATMQTLAGVGQSVHGFAADMKLLAHSDVAQMFEGRNPKDAGSSFMPWKVNPRHSETSKSLARSLPGKASEAWHNAAEVTQERGLEDSAGKRSYLPDAFLATDEILRRTKRSLGGFRISERRIQATLNQYLPYFTLGGLMAELPRRGADRSTIHDIFHEHSRAAQEAIEATGHNPLSEMITGDPRLHEFMGEGDLAAYFADFKPNVGNAPERCEQFLEEELYPAIGGKPESVAT